MNWQHRALSSRVDQLHMLPLLMNALFISWIQCLLLFGILCYILKLGQICNKLGPVSASNENNLQIYCQFYS